MCFDPEFSSRDRTFDVEFDSSGGDFSVEMAEKGNLPQGDVLIDANGQHDVARYATATVSVSGITDHSELENLEYENSGHTGFQQEIEDIEDIRSGAALGATAVQPEILEGYARVPVINHNGVMVFR